MSISTKAENAWQDALLAAALTAVSPQDVGGLLVRSAPGPVRDAWLETFRDMLPDGLPWRQAPAGIDESRLLGGLDLAATLGTGSTRYQKGLLEECDGGIMLLRMAERARRTSVACICEALDRGQVPVERDGFSRLVPARVGVVALDESLDEEEGPSSALTDRLAFHVDLGIIGLGDTVPSPVGRAEIETARRRYRFSRLHDADLERLCGAGAALGVDSMRASLYAARVAMLAAALMDRSAPDEDDLALAVRLVLVPRATAVPSLEDQEQEAESLPNDGGDIEEADTQPDTSGDSNQRDPGPGEPETLEDRVLQAAGALIPRALLESVRSDQRARAQNAAMGRSGAQRFSRLRGRPVGATPGDPRSGARLDVLATLRAAAPWQTIRRRELAKTPASDRRVEVRRQDFRVVRYRERAESTVIFAVDASGSAALHRLAEAKGAVELLLADCYVRRDRVALVAFRGSHAETLLPPTRSLVRAKRSLGALPGGGGTPLAAGLEAAAVLADSVVRRGGTPTVVVLTDGRANVCRDGSTGREAAHDDAMHIAAGMRRAAIQSLVVDTGARPHPKAAELARAMAGRYVPLPQGDAGALSRVVKIAGGDAGPSTAASRR